MKFTSNNNFLSNNGVQSVNNIQDDIALVDKRDDLVLSDQKEALDKLSKDDDFVNELISQRNVKDMQKLFDARGVVLNFDEIDSFIDMVKSYASKQELPDDFFEDAAAGVWNNWEIGDLACATANKINNSPESQRLYQSIFSI